MRNFRTFVNDPAGNDPADTNFLGATNINNMTQELENAVTRSGQSLTTDDGTPDANVDQLAESLFIHGTKAQTFQAGGTANAIQLTPVSGASGVLVPSSYDDMDGARVVFAPASANTGNVTASIGQTSGGQLASRPVLDITGAQLAAGAIATSRHAKLIYDASASGGSGAWILEESASGGATGDVNGPASSVNNNLVLFDGTGGKTIKDAGVGLADLQGRVKVIASDTQTTTFSTTQLIPFDNTVPLVSEGSELFSASITPTATTDVVDVMVSIPAWSSLNANSGIVVSVFRGTTCINAAGVWLSETNDDVLPPFALNFQDAPNSTSSLNYSVRIGSGAANTLRVNAQRDTTQLFGGAAEASLLLKVLDAS